MTHGNPRLRRQEPQQGVLRDGKAFGRGLFEQIQKETPLQYRRNPRQFRDPDIASPYFRYFWNFKHVKYIIGEISTAHKFRKARKYIQKQLPVPAGFLLFNDFL